MNPKNLPYGVDTHQQAYQLACFVPADANEASAEPLELSTSYKVGAANKDGQSEVLGVGKHGDPGLVKAFATLEEAHAAATFLAREFGILVTVRTADGRDATRDERDQCKALTKTYSMREALVRGKSKKSARGYYLGPPRLNV